MFSADLLTNTALLVLASSSTDALCQMPKRADISVIPSAADVVYDTSKTLKEIQKQHVDTINPYGFNQTTHTNGYMSGLITMQPRVKLDYARAGNLDAACIWYDSVALDIRIEPEIVIAKEVAADRCMYKAVKEHELKHVMVDRKIVNKYAQSMGRKIFDGLKQRGFIVGPIPSENAAAVADRMRETVAQLVEIEYKKMEIERTEAQQAVDSLEEYQRVSAECPNYKSPHLYTHKSASQKTR